MATIPDLDIWRAANLLVQQHGADAEIQAARRAELCSNGAILTAKLSGSGSDGRSPNCRLSRAGRHIEPRRTAMAVLVSGASAAASPT